LSHLATSGGGLTYTATFTANAGTDISFASVSVSIPSYTETSVQAGTRPSSGSFVVDTVIPTVTVSIDNHDVNVAHGTGTVTFARSEERRVGTQARSRATGCLLSDMATSDGGLANTSTLTPHTCPATSIASAS